MLSALAVDNEIVGRGTAAGLIAEENACCLSDTTACSAAVALCISCFFGVVVKMDRTRLLREVADRFEFDLSPNRGGVELVNGIENRRGIL